MKAVIFDCDGTLVDSEGLWHEVLVAAIAEHGLILSVAEANQAFRGGNMADCMADIEARLGRPLPADFVPVLRTRTADVFRTRLRPIEGAVELLQSLSRSSRPVCVASSGPREKIELSLSLTGLWPFFEGRVFSSYDVGVWKPDPGLFLHAAQAMGVAAEDCAVVEDSLPGIRAGLAAGMTVFAFQPHDVDPRVPSEVTILKNLLELRGLLGFSAAEPAVAAEDAHRFLEPRR
ncbi:MAG TPA: HAD-IA family hydrolase [Polyangiaceae bacterium]|nr:HAD-IA family hydrolase [Polyangiaceae bacterium]